MNGTELKASIESGLYWSDCHWRSCSNKIHSDHIETYSDEDDYVEKPPQIILSALVQDAVFCSGRCRRKAEAEERRVSRRRRRIIAKAFTVFGRAMEVKSCSGNTRDGVCKCELTPPRTEYPGVIDLRLPGVLMYGFHGCVFCRQWGVCNIDHEAWRTFIKDRQGDDEMKDWTGKRFGRLEVLRLVERRVKFASGRKRLVFVFECRCDCGDRHLATLSDLQKKNTRSCGCLKAETWRKTIAKRHLGQTLQSQNGRWLMVQEGDRSALNSGFRNIRNSGKEPVTLLNSEGLSINEEERNANKSNRRREQRGVRPADGTRDASRRTADQCLS